MKPYDGCVDEKNLPWVDQHQPPQYWGAPRSASAVGLHSLTSSASEHFDHDDDHIHYFPLEILERHFSGDFWDAIFCGTFQYRSPSCPMNWWWGQIKAAGKVGGQGCDWIDRNL